MNKTYRTRVEKDRLGMYQQGVNHRRFGMAPYWSHHKHFSDYMDGYHGREFRKAKRRSPVARFFLWLSGLFGG